MPATRPLARALLFTLALTTHPSARGPTGTPGTASPPAFQRAAATPPALTTAHSLHVNLPNTCQGLPTAPTALLHGAPHTHATAPAQPERDHGSTPPDITHAARAHNRPLHLDPLAGHSQLTQAHSRPTRPHGTTRPHQAHTHISVQPILTRATARSNDQNNGVAPFNSSYVNDNETHHETRSVTRSVTRPREYDREIDFTLGSETQHASPVTNNTNKPKTRTHTNACKAEPICNQIATHVHDHRTHERHANGR